MAAEFALDFGTGAWWGRATAFWLSPSHRRGFVDTAGTSNFQHLLRHQYAGYLPYNSGRKVAMAI
jgi:hypothetical protein